MSYRAAALLVFLLAASACDIKVNEGGVSLGIAEGRASDEWRRTYTIAPGGQLEIVNANGAIHATPSTSSAVEVTARREVRTQDEATSRELLAKVEMLEEVAPGRVRIEGRAGLEQPAGAGMGRRPQVNIEYQVSIPPGLRVHLKTENGAVRLENVSGSLVAASTNGGITGSGVSGSLTATTVNGGIQVELTSVTGDIEIMTVNGGIRLELPADVNAVLDARAVNGGVSIDEQFRFEATERARLHVAGRLNAGGPRISAQTTNGGVRVTPRGQG